MRRLARQLVFPFFQFLLKKRIKIVEELDIKWPYQLRFVANK
jgi:hypothetical protein